MHTFCNICNELLLQTSRVSNPKKVACPSKPNFSISNSISMPPTFKDWRFENLRLRVQSPIGKYKERRNEANVNLQATDHFPPLARESRRHNSQSHGPSRVYRFPSCRNAGLCRKMIEIKPPITETPRIRTSYQLSECFITITASQNHCHRPSHHLVGDGY